MSHHHHHKCECKREKHKEKESCEKRESGGILDCLCGGNNSFLIFLVFILLIIGCTGIFGDGFI